jgi:hypothetical protein
MIKLDIQNLIYQTQNDLMVAESKFNMAKNDINMDLAAVDIKAAEDKLNLLYRKAREVEKNEGM